MNAWRHSALGLLLLAVSAHASAALDDGLPAAGSSLNLEPTSKGYEVSFDVGFAENFTVVSVTSPDGALTLDPLVMKTEAQPARVKRVIVRVTGGKLRAKSYPLTIVATHKIKKDNKDVQEQIERDVLLVLPASTLDTPETLVINRVCATIVWDGACLWRDMKITAKLPQLAETTRRGWLTGISLNQKGAIDSGDEPAGTLEFKSMIDDITPAVDHHTLVHDTHYSLNGDFPLGTAKGTLLIQADQLATPVSVPFEIRTKTTALLLLFALGLGLFLGWLTRSFLKRRHDLNQEKQKTFALLALIDAALANTEDETLRSALSEARKPAAVAAQISKAAEIAAITSKTEAAQKAFDEAQTALRTKRAEADQAYLDALNLLRAMWHVSESLATAMKEARTALEAVLPTRARNNMTKELEALDTELREVLDVADKEVTKYSSSVAGNDGVIALLVPLMDSIGATALRSIAKPEKAPAETLPSATRDKLLPALLAALEYVHRSGEYIDETLKLAPALVVAQLSAWDQQLANSSLLARPLWLEWQMAARTLMVKICETPKNSGASIVTLSPRVEQLVPMLSETLLAQVEVKDQPAIQERLEASAFASAVSKVEALTRQIVFVNQVGTLESLGSASGAAAATTFAGDQAERGNSQAQLIFPGGARDFPMVASGVAQSPQLDNATTAILAAASKRALEVTGGLLSWIYAGLILAGGYWLFEESWVGTLRDFSVAFFWAFTTDVGADAATTAVKGLKKS